MPVLWISYGGTQWREAVKTFTGGVTIYDVRLELIRGMRP